MSRESVVIGRELGHGAFGEVFEGTATGVPGVSAGGTVAIKASKNVPLASYNLS